MIKKTGILAPGSRVVIRDAEWLIRRVDNTSSGGQAVSVVGISELVRDKEAIFLTEVEKKFTSGPGIQVLMPEQTKLVQDKSAAYQASILYMESLLRFKPPTDEQLYLGYRAAMDLVDYQLEPALQALSQPRQRILIADAVGLGKTLEAGILLSELIRRGRGKRILVLTTKSMLTQFQKEMWNRFTIPLTRLDSVGIQKIRAKIPTNHNPFYYYDKAIISIDTLKQDAEYRVYIENAYWDIIVIDEAHNVAERGHSSSMRAKLAKMLSQRSDTLIMLSATPHDGRAASFASLMNMLDPTAIANPEKYGPEDIKGLFIRRFKKDIQEQVKDKFQERVIDICRAQASGEEEKAYDNFTQINFTRINAQQNAGMLFKVTLEKALFSSPAACLETIKNRINRLKNQNEDDYEHDIGLLEDLAVDVAGITPDKFAKYQELLKVIKDKKSGFGWDGKAVDDRLVIFTERIETLRFLKENLITDLKLKEGQVAILHGGMSDLDQQKVVEEFGKELAPVRLLLASDVASEGINLHYLCHKMIHFDIPWSLMVFAQRNGRIDRYGQKNQPVIKYLITESSNEKIRGDYRILELLIKKDQEAMKNIGDPQVIMGVFDVDEEIRITSEAITKGMAAADFEKQLTKTDSFDLLAFLMGSDDEAEQKQCFVPRRELQSLYRDDYSYLKAAVEYIGSSMKFHREFDDRKQRIDITAPEELKHRLRNMPDEILPGDSTFILSSDIKQILKEIENSRKEENAWPSIHYLWPLHPVVEWVNDKVAAAFGRHEAPVLSLTTGLESDEIIFIMSGLVPNRKGHPLVHHWFGVVFRQGKSAGICSFEDIVKKTGIGNNHLSNRGTIIDIDELNKLLPEAVEQSRVFMSKKQKEFQSSIDKKLNSYLDDLDRLRSKKAEQLEIQFGSTELMQKNAEKKKEQKYREIESIFDEYVRWAHDTMTTEDKPYIQVIAVLRGEM